METARQTNNSEIIGNKVAFLGMGVMGSAMAANLAKADFHVNLWNRTLQSDRVRKAVEAGCVAMPSIKSAVAGANFVCICVSDIHDVEKVLFETDGGAANGASDGAVIIDFSTGSPESAKRFAERATSINRSLQFIDAPVTGGDTGAKEASLTVIAGGCERVIAEASRIFHSVGKRVFRCGPVGSGQAMKLSNQVLCAIHAVALAEAFAFAKHNGIDATRMIEICASGAGDSWALRNLGARILADDLESGFSIPLMRKDLRLIRETGCTLPGVELADELMRLSLHQARRANPATQATICAYSGNLHAKPPSLHIGNPPYEG